MNSENSVNQQSNQQSEIESQPVSSTDNLSSKLASRLNQMWESLSCNLLREREPQIRKRSDRFGNTWWTAYDPVSGRSSMCSSEREIQIWLEQIRYR